MFTAVITPAVTQRLLRRSEPRLQFHKRRFLLRCLYRRKPLVANKHLLLTIDYPTWTLHVICQNEHARSNSCLNSCQRRDFIPDKQRSPQHMILSYFSLQELSGE